MYRVLYRKWRPQTFEDVSGQPHITATLKNELLSGRVAHAYLFTGSRGTGKTTCAKILSKAVNCLEPVNGNPCNECEICQGIDNGSILDVIEIDAASNNGVDNIRDLRDEANFTPVKSKYRVYIIDEVHMLSTGAFNALLKILEEPPEHVIFILATTEVHKLPATILSRCQRFDFKRISPEDICKRLQFVAEKENLTLDDDAAALIAKIADGALRDALSLLDRCCATSDKITADIVTKSAGLAGRDYLTKLSHCIIEKDCAKALGIINELHINSCDMERLCSEFMFHLRDLMITKTVKNADEVLICTEDELAQLKSLSSEISLEELLYSLNIVETSLSDIKRSTNKRIPLEMAFVKMCSEQLDSGNEALLKRIASLEAKLTSGDFTVKTENKVSSAAVQPKEETKPVENIQTKVEEKPKVEKITSPIEEPTPTESVSNNGEAVPFQNWAEVIDELKKTDMPLVGILNGASAYVRDNFLLIKSDNPALSTFIRKDLHASFLSKAIVTVTGKQYKIGLYKQPEKQSSKDPLEGLIKKIEDFKNS
ncbi:MAG: DNA polymerase III subunit gamma/tau [Clostridia bacterium]|nr:DNA polymerase III subunit gamma/tau [Clostridia bacterium]